MSKLLFWRTSAVERKTTGDMQHIHLFASKEEALAQMDDFIVKGYDEVALQMIRCVKVQPVRETPRWPAWGLGTDSWGKSTGSPPGVAYVGHGEYTGGGIVDQLRARGYRFEGDPL